MHEQLPADRHVAHSGNPPIQVHSSAAIDVLFRAKRFREAREAIEQSLIQTPDDRRLLRRLVWACNHLGDGEAAQDALERLDEATGSQNDSGTPAAVAAYDHDAVSATEYAELLGARTPSTDDDHRSREPVAPDHHREAASEVAASSEVAPPPCAANDVADSPDEDLPVLPPVDDALLAEIDESPAQILEEAFSDSPGSPTSLTIFDDKADGLEAFDLIEVQEARQATRLTGSARITRRLRARQQAAAMLGRLGYGDSSDIDAIAEIFFHFGWNSCSRALESQLYRGATPSDLAIAHRARLAWASNPLLNASAAFTNERWRAPQSPFPSWTLATALTKAFTGIPSDDEIYALLEREFDRYLASNALQRDYGSFSAYLTECRLDPTGRHLPASMSSDFDTDWSLTDSDPIDRWETCVPAPKVFGLLGLLEPVIDRLTFPDNLFSDLHAHR